jgi:hypothetical protein
MQVILDTLGLSGTIKKTPVVVGNCTGFAVNRVFFPYTMSACLLADLGQNPYEVRGSVFWGRRGRGVEASWRGHSMREIQTGLGGGGGCLLGGGGWRDVLGLGG